MPNYKLYYFDARGRAEVCRLMFAAKDVEYEDIRLTRDEWEQFKPEALFDLLPVLEVEGEKFAQSVAINSYVARELGFHGKTNLESLAIDQVVTLVYDFIEKGVVAHTQKDEAKRTEMLKEYADFDVPKYFGYFEKLLKAKGTGYFVRSELTLADIAVFDFSCEVEMRFPGQMEKFPEIKALCERVKSVPEIKTHIENRKSTPF